MRKSIFFLLLLCSFGYAQQIEGPLAAKHVSGAEAVRYSERTGNLSYVRFGPDGPRSFEELSKKPQPWMPKVKGQLSFRDISSFGDELGMTHVRKQILLEGVPVEGGILIAHYRNGRLESVNGDLFDIDRPFQQPALSESLARDLAVAEVPASRYKWEESVLATGLPQFDFYPQPQLVWAPVDGEYKPNNFRLAYKVDVYAAHPLSRQWIFVDAENGSILYKLNRIHTADVTGSAATKYSGTLAIVADQTGPTNYRLRETGRGGGITTLNCQQGTNTGAAVDFLDSDNFWNNINAAHDEVATDAHIGTEATFDYYQLTHSWNSYDNNNSPLLSYVHFDVNFENAFWDGTSMTYGDGDPSGFVFFTPTTTFDVCAHEITHGVTEFSAGLIYAGESGALNESFSDIFGNVVENYARPSNFSWLIAEDCSGGAGIRNMANPPAFNDPDCYGGPLWQSGADVHINSGVQNKWFHLLTVGGTGTNAIGNAYNVAGQGMVKAAAIAFRNLTVYLTPSSDYADARFYAVQSASDIYGNCGPEMIATINAWHAVGVGGAYTNTPQANFVAQPNSSCSAPATFQFTNTSNGTVTYLWDFGDGNTSTAANPTHTYANLGTYNVKLIGTSCNGSVDSILRSNYIVIDTNLACTYTLPTSGNLLVSSCEGTVYDPGGLGDYPDNANSIITISPPGASSVTLNFVSFNLEQGWDFLDIYDGPTTGSPLIGSFTGTNLPNGGTISSTGGSITMAFSSDGSVTAPGFEVDFACLNPNAPPQAGFAATPYLTCDGLVQFSNQSQNGVSYQWNFGDGGTSTLAAPSHMYTTQGVYSVTLIACNTLGCDTLAQPAFIIYDPNAAACQTTTLPTNGTSTYTACSGTLLDNGGTNDYTDNVDVVAILAPPGASQVSLSFSQFDLEQGWDFLDVHDGNSIAAPLLGSFTGSNLPNGGAAFLSSGGALTVHFTTDASVTAPGFVANWGSAGSSSGPTANFSAVTTASVGQVINFTDNSTGGTYWSWNFGDGNGSSQQNPSHSYAANGTYTVTLRVTNSQGCDDTYTQNIEVGGGVGIEPGNNLVMEVYPNPARDAFVLKLAAGTAISGQLHLRNAMGQTLQSISLSNEQVLEMQMDVRSFPRGIYFLTLETNGIQINRKVVLQ